MPAAEGPHALRSLGLCLPSGEFAVRSGRASLRHAAKSDYFDWNEVRVSTVRELAEVTKPLVDSSGCSNRLKQTLHCVFEAVYQFDLEIVEKEEHRRAGQAAPKAQRQHAVHRRVRHADGPGRPFDPDQPRPVGRHDSRRRDLRERGESRARSLVSSAPFPRTREQSTARCCTNSALRSAAAPTVQPTRKLLLEIDPNCKARLPKRQTPPRRHRRRRPQSNRPTPKPRPAKVPERQRAKHARAARPKQPARRLRRRVHAMQAPKRKSRSQNLNQPSARQSPARRRRRRKRSQPVTRSPNANRDKRMQDAGNRGQGTNDHPCPLFPESFPDLHGRTFPLGQYRPQEIADRQQARQALEQALQSDHRRCQGRRRRSRR